MDPKLSWQKRAAKVSLFALMGLVTTAVASDFKLIKLGVLASKSIGSMTILGLGINVLDAAESAFTLWDIVLVSPPNKDATQKEKNVHFWRVLANTQNIALIVIGVGLTAAGIPALPVVLTMKVVKLGIENVESAKDLCSKVKAQAAKIRMPKSLAINLRPMKWTYKKLPAAA
jgi:hypothetical protein